MLFSKKAQGIEYIGVFAIVLTIVAVMGYALYALLADTTSSFDSSQIEEVGNEVMRTVQQIYALGSGNRVTLDAVLPDGLDQMRIVHREASDGNYYRFMQIDYYHNGELHVFEFSPVNENIRFNCIECGRVDAATLNHYNTTFLSEDYTPGAKKIRIESFGDVVGIEFVKYTDDSRDPGTFTTWVDRSNVVDQTPATP